MDIKPSLFVSTTTPAQPSNSASEARRAFEAMLAASAARTRSTQAPILAQESPRALPTTKAATPTVSQDMLSRPGRVLDIKV